MSESRSNELIPVEITVETLKAKIYTVRGQRSSAFFENLIIR